MRIFNRTAAALLLVLLINPNIYTQDFGKKTILKSDVLLPTAALFSNYNFRSFSIETLLFSQSSIQVSYLGAEWSLYRQRNGKYFEVGPEYKFFLREEYKGLYLGAYSKYTQLDENYYGIIYHFINHSIAFGGLAGYQVYFFKNTITVDFLIALGHSWLVSSESVAGYPYAESKNLINGRIALNLGFRF